MCEPKAAGRVPAAAVAAALGAVAVSAAAAVIGDLVLAAGVAVSLAIAAGLGFLVHVLRRDGWHLSVPADTEPAPLALAAARARAIAPPRTVIPGVVLDGQEAAR